MANMNEILDIVAEQAEDDKCQCCGEVARLICGPSRFGPETWACWDCWNPTEDHG